MGRDGKGLEDGRTESRAGWEVGSDGQAILAMDAGEAEMGSACY